MIPRPIGFGPRCVPDAWPTGRAQHDDGKPVLGWVLLIAHVPIGRDKDLESMILGGPQQFTVAHRRPSHFMRGSHLMPDPLLAQWGWRTLVKQHTHSRFGHRTACSMFEHGSDLFQIDPWKEGWELLS